ncbi:hypothetical protein VTL71DRAFT_6223 [Oculimacula yallundae]|uniref:Uncharacterized protein n=1 Tax=Oculimacula yallundae TaxID=86028 RepID=A0ABR4C185_9HELO
MPATQPDSGAAAPRQGAARQSRSFGRPVSSPAMWQAYAAAGSPTGEEVLSITVTTILYTLTVNDPAGGQTSYVGSLQVFLQTFE